MSIGGFNLDMLAKRLTETLAEPAEKILESIGETNALLRELIEAQNETNRLLGELPKESSTRMGQRLR